MPSVLQWRCLAAALVALLIAGLGAAPAYAHATLLETDPAQGARLDQAPSEVRLTFSEPVTVVPEAIRLVGTEQTTLEPRTRDTVVVVPLPTLALDARHTVAWRVVSADGHPISGLLTFSVGNPPATDNPPATPEASVPGQAADRPLVASAQIAVTGMWYTALLLVAGLLAFRALCVRDAGPPGPSERMIRVLAVAGGVAALLLTVLLPLSLAVDPTTDLASGWAAAGWRTPVAAALTCAGLGAAALLHGRRRTTPALVAAAVALASPVLTGHSAALSPSWLMVGSDLAHLVAGAVWTGGVLGLMLHLRAAGCGDRPVRDAAVTVRRFSTLAASALLTAGVTGVTMAVLILPDWSALTATPFGRLLLVKVGLVAVTTLLGGWNRLRLLPALDRASAAARPWAALNRILHLEVAVLAAVILIAGALVHQSPGGPSDTQRHQPGSDHGPLVTGVMAIRGQSDRLVITGTATPSRDGSTQLQFTAVDPAGEQVHPIEPPTVSAALPLQNLGPTRYESHDSPSGPHGTYLVELDTPLRGRWVVLIGVRLSAFTQETVRVDLDLG